MDSSNKMIRDADEFVRVLSKQEETAKPLAQLKRQLKNFSKNELIRTTSALLIAKNILEERLQKYEKPDVSSADPSVTASEPESSISTPETQQS